MLEQVNKRIMEVSRCIIDTDSGDRETQKMRGIVAGLKGIASLPQGAIQELDKQIAAYERGQAHG